MNFCFLFVCTIVLVPSLGSRDASNSKYSFTHFLSGVNRFTADFYEILSKDQKNNFISSPISVLMVLAMAACGANGNTRRELIQTLHTPMVSGFRLTNFRRFINSLKINSNTTNVELHLANKIFINNNFEIEWLFDHTTEHIFQSRIQSIDFKDANGAANKINKWCRQETNNKITNLIKRDDLEDAKLIMVNAVYFKGQWVHPFDSEPVKRLFYLTEKNPVKIPMMYTNAEYKNGPLPNLGASYIELPYKAIDSKRGFSMFIILPEKIDGIDSIGNRLHKINFMQLNGTKENIILCMPKFRIETELNLIPTLKKMGIHDMFKASADFSNINPEENLTVTKVIQKAFINVDEKGSEAAAATGGVLGFRQMTFEITVDRPFICAIVSKLTGTPLFWARINDPRTVSI